MAHRTLEAAVTAPSNPDRPGGNSPGGRGIAAQLRTARRRFAQPSMAVGDQVLRSLSTMLLTFSMAHALPVHEFGQFAVVFAVAVLAVNGSRYLSSIPFILEHGHDPAVAKEETARPASMSFAMGAILATLFLVAGLLTDGVASTTLVLYAVGMPALLAQEARRNAWFASDHIPKALRNDAVLLAVQAAITFGAAGAIDRPGVTPVLGYIGGTWVALILTGSPRTYLTWSSARLHFGASWRSWPALAVEFAVTSGIRSGVPIVVSLAASTTAAGHYRAAESVIGILNVLFMGLSSYLGVLTVRVRDDLPGTRRLIRQWGLLSLAAVTLAVAFIEVTWDLIWSPLLGAAGDGARPLIVPIAVAILLNQQVILVLMAIRAQGMLAATANVRVLSGPPLLVCVAFGAWFEGALGAAVGVAAGYAIAYVVAQVTFRRKVVDRVPEEAGEPVVEA